MIIQQRRTVHGPFGKKTASSRLSYILQYSTPVKMSRHIRESPWLEHLRSANLQQRRPYLMRGGIFPELLPLLRSAPHPHPHFLPSFSSPPLHPLPTLSN